MVPQTRGVGIHVLLLSKVCPPHTHTVSLYNSVDAHRPVILQCLLLSSAGLCNSSKWCLPSLVSPSSCTILLLWCKVMHITILHFHKTLISLWKFQWSYLFSCHLCPSLLDAHRPKQTRVTHYTNKLRISHYYPTSCLTENPQCDINSVHVKL